MALNEKMTDKISFPVHGLDMGPYVLSHDSGEVSSLVYDLHGVINHYGSLYGGHYTALAKNSPTGKWFHYNDSVVNEVESDAEIVSDAAYVLFYQLRGLKESIAV